MSLLALADPADSLSAASVVCLAIAVALALAFEFVNGFHDTANAVATVIYTHTLPPRMAVVWSGLCNLARRADQQRAGRLHDPRPAAVGAGRLERRDRGRASR